MYLKSFPAWEIENTKFYLCGPVSFMQSMKKELLEHGVEPEKIFKEVFGPDLLNDLN
jgi:nitric oxide dioxygenase